MRLLSVIFMAVFFLLINVNAEAQRSRTRTSRTSRTSKTTEPEPSKLVYEIRVGNIGFNQGVSLSAKPGIGYNLSKTFAGGINTRLLFDYFNRIGADDITTFSYGAAAFARGKVSEKIYLQADYGFLNFTNPNGPDTKIYYPSVGGGWMQTVGGSGSWSYGIELMVPLNNVMRDYFGVVEYYGTFIYNF